MSTSSFLEIKVIASAGQEKWALDSSGKLKCYLKSPAHDGKANKELCSRISRLLKVPTREIIIVRGHSHQHKVIKIPLKLSQEDFITLLGLE